jgi:cholinesterase
LYNFTNIRYAQPPVGNLRFAAPVAPEGREEKIQDGSGWRQCPNAYPIWSLIAGKYAAAFATGNTESFDYEAAAAEVDEFVKEAGIPAVYAQPNPAVTEDCLFLDVVVPKKVFESEEPKAPVLVW